ncbi:hypothetical protein [Tistrella bauzanensis]|uniref:hypothetical protein n=1 Tax=Tistrella bauzanensis TaxID=657419 RepID=UPI003555D6D2
MEQARKLVEQDNVRFLYNALGTSANTAVRPYLAARKVPQVLINSGASKWLAPAENPWVTTGLPQNRTEAVIFARHILETMPDTKVGLRPMISARITSRVCATASATRQTTTSSRSRLSTSPIRRSTPRS